MKALFIRAQLHAMVLVCLCATGPAVAQTVYRCGSSYSDTPCPQALRFPAADPRTREQKAQTERATTQAAMLAEKLEKSRRIDEGEAIRRAQTEAKAAAPATKTAHENKPDGEAAPHKNGKKNKKATTAPLQQTKKPKLNKPQKPQSFTATVPAPKKPKP